MIRVLKTLLILIAFVILCGFGTYEYKYLIKKENDKIEVSFTKKMNSSDLIKIKKSLALKGIVIVYKSFYFDKNGGLKSLSFSVDCNDGFKGGASNNDINIQTKWGFYRDYSENAESPFGTGRLK